MNPDGEEQWYGEEDGGAAGVEFHPIWQRDRWMKLIPSRRSWISQAPWRLRVGARLVRGTDGGGVDAGGVDAGGDR